MAANAQNEEKWFLNSTFPVAFPSHPAFTMSEADFAVFAKNELQQIKDEQLDQDMTGAPETAVPTSAPAASELTPVSTQDDAADTAMQTPSGPQRMIDGLVNFDQEANEEKKDQEAAAEFESKGLMLTENMDIAHATSKSAVLDLFYELEPVVSGERLKELLTKAWEEDAVMTLKIIFNARSIHLGKGAKNVFYRCAGWLASKHPLTLINNLRWVTRPVIEKKVQKDEGKEKSEDAVMIDFKDVDESDPAHFDVRFGVAHGYWKDLLNILVLDVNHGLDVDTDPAQFLNVDNRKNLGTVKATPEFAKAKRADDRIARHKNAVELFTEGFPFYRVLHITVARLFAHQLKADLALLRGDDVKAKKMISPCGKWAPSLDRQHDMQTYIATSIAEILHPAAEFDNTITVDREVYLRYARDAYRKDLSALRAHLEVVERDLTAETFERIKYERVPSIAMSNYSGMFARKDEEHFAEYLTNVASGKVKISGAVLLPSTLVLAARGGGHGIQKKEKNMLPALKKKIAEMEAQVVDAQWKTLVQRIRDSGTLDNAIAVCDVSGSMGSPRFPDGTCPLDSAIGLSLLLAEVTKAPFGGHFITFSSDPTVQKIDLTASLHDKVRALNSAHWSMNTDFVAVFERLILPMAIKEKLKPEEMVKRVFVFSDMQFDAANSSHSYGYGEAPVKFDKWDTSYERIKKQFEDAGYEMPELVFWNLAGGRAGYAYGTDGDEIAPKPVTKEDVGTALVSGYSQGMLKVFLDNGSFEDPEEEEPEEEEVTVESDDEDNVQVEKTAKRRKTDPMAVVRKAVGHKAYEMLRVFD